MTTEKKQPQDELQSQHESAQTQKSAASQNRESKLFAFKANMMLSMKDYKIIFCIALVLLILGAIRAVYLPMFFFGLFIGGVYTGGDRFIDFIIFLPTFIWALSIIFLPIVLVLHVIIDRRLKAMIQKLGGPAEQQDKSIFAQTF
ncbi:hypothetical protein [Bartonella machadoae]|uniref:hypothetical protein n=1 Tax=Bartonella machadoae TaxID=2893471 RepID=UPI001F4D0413|nr:hypothetical protein [Bartonella machadoae]UNE53955.1 hypothetical protein LNM86_10290 [Bartonella machadoae]